MSTPRGPRLTVAEWQWIERVARTIAARYDDEEALPVADKIDAYLTRRRLTREQRDE